jgi:hypothetical protein
VPFVEAATADGNWLVSIAPSFANRWAIALSAMTELYTGEIPLEQVRAAYSRAQKRVIGKNGK